MAKARVKHKGFRIPKNGMDTKIQEIMKEAARTYVLAAYRYINVDTGMSRATLLPLARYLDVANSIPVNPKRTLKGKSPAEGEARTTYSFGTSGSVYSFEWTANVKQYFLNDQFALRSNKGSPWRSLEIGNIKVRNYLLSRGPELLKAFRQSWTTQVRSI